jgi:hypothetical protein
VCIDAHEIVLFLINSNKQNRSTVLPEYQNVEDSCYSRSFTVFSVAGPYMNASGTMFVKSISNQPEMQTEGC